jgi:hypothetical protein
LWQLSLYEGLYVHVSWRGSLRRKERKDEV